MKSWNRVLSWFVIIKTINKNLNLSMYIINTTGKALSTVFAHSLLLYQKTPLFAAHTPSISDALTTRE